jgi:hypothetical protein
MQVFTSKNLKAGWQKCCRVNTLGDIERKKIPPAFFFL